MQDNEEKSVASSTDAMSRVTGNNQNDNNNADRNSLSHFATSQMEKSNADIRHDIADNKSANNGDENDEDDDEEDEDVEDDENGDNVSRKGKTKDHHTKKEYGDFSDRISKEEKLERNADHSIKSGTEHENEDQFETLENMEVEYQRKAFDSKRTTGEYVQEEQSYSGEDETKCCCSCPINQKSCGCCCNHPTKNLEPIVSSVSLPEPEKNISTKIYLEKSRRGGVHTFDVGTDEETGSDFYGDKVSSSSRVVTEKNRLMAEDPPMEDGEFETNDQSEVNEETNTISFPSENNNSEDQFLEEVNKKTEFDYLDSAMKDINMENENFGGSMTSVPANGIREDDTFIDDEDFSRQKRSSKQNVLSPATERAEDDYDVQSVNSRVTFKDNSKDHCCCYCKKDETCCCICKQTVDDDGGRSIGQSSDLRKVESQSFGTLEDEDNKNLEVDFEESMADFSYSKVNENSNEFDASGDGIDNRQEDEYDAGNSVKINNEEDAEAFEYLDEAESRYIPKKFFPDFFKNLSSYFGQELPEIKSKTTTKIAPPKSFIVKEVIRFNHTRDYQTYEIKFSMFTKIVFGQEITKDIKVTGRSFKRNVITEIVQCNNTNYDTKIDVSLSRGQFIYFSSCYKPTNGNKNIKIIRVDSLQIGNVTKKIEVTTLKTRNVPAIKIVLDVAFSGIKLGRRFDIKEITAETEGNHKTYSTTINSDEVINETNTLLETEDEKDKKLDYFYKKFKELSYILNLYTNHGAKNRSKANKHGKKTSHKANLTSNEVLNQISLARKGSPSKRGGEDIFFDEKDAQELPIRTRSVTYPVENLTRTSNSSFNSTANAIFNNVYNLIYKIVQDLTALDKMEVMLIKTTGTNGTLNPMNLKELSKYISKLIVKKVMESNPNNLTTISDILFGKRGIASEIISKKELLDQLRNITLESLSALPKKEDIEVSELLKLVTVPVLRRKDMKKRKKLKKLGDSFRNKGYFSTAKQVTSTPREKKSKNQMTALYDDNQMTFLVRPFRDQKTAHSKGKHTGNKMNAMDKFEMKMIEIDETPWKPTERRKFVKKGYILPKMFDVTAIHVDKSENLSMNLNGKSTPEALTERPKLVVKVVSSEPPTTSKSKVTGYKDEDFASPDEIIGGGVSTQLDEDVVFENGFSSTAVMETAYGYNIRNSSTESTTAKYGDSYKNVRELIVKNVDRGYKINETPTTNIKLKIPPKIQNSSSPSTWTARRRKIMKVVRKNHVPLATFSKAKKNFTEEIVTNITETLSVKEVGQKEVVLSEESIYSEVTNKINEKKLSLLRNNSLSRPIIDKPPTSFMDLFKLFER